MSMWIALSGIGFVILVGFFAVLIFRRTGFPDILVLILLGFILGPVTGLIDREMFLKAASFFGALALLIIMLDGGLSLDFESVLRQFRYSFALVILGFSFSFGVLTAVFYYTAGMDLYRSMILSSALSCSSAAIVVPLLKEVRVPEEIRTALSLEAALSDTLAVVVTIVLINYVVVDDFSTLHLLPRFFTAFVISVVIGFAAGYGWARLLTRYYDLPFDYMLTFAVLLILHGFLELIHGSGPLGVMMFGLVISNVKPIEKRIRRNLVFFGLRMKKRADTINENFLWFHEEITFLIRVFFFVYIGALFDIEGLSVRLVSVSLLVVAALLAVRFVVVSGLALKWPVFARFRGVMLTTAPRGLASAVLALIPFSISMPGTEDFGRYALLVIVISNVILSGGILHHNGLARLKRKTGSQ